jgi:hypothetical protein
VNRTVWAAGHINIKEQRARCIIEHVNQKLLLYKRGA